MKQLKNLKIFNSPTNVAHKAQIVKPDQLEFAIKNLNSRQLSLVNTIISFAHRYGSVYPSQISMARRERKCHKTINRDFNKIFGMQILFRRRRYNNSCLYYLNPLLLTQPLYEKVCHYLPALRKILVPVFMLLCGFSNGNVHILNNVNNIAIRNNSFIIDPSYNRTILERSVMNIQEKGPLFDCINNLPLNLSRERKIYLTQYCAQALESALEDLHNAPRVANPWGYFLSRCEAYHHDNKIHIDTEWMFNLRIAYGIKSTPDIYSAPCNLIQQGESSKAVSKKNTPTSAMSIKQQIDSMPVPKSPLKKKPIERYTPPVNPSTPHKIIHNLPKPPPPKVNKATERTQIRPVLEEYAEWQSFLLTPKGRSSNDNYRRAFGCDIPFKRQADLDALRSLEAKPLQNDNQKV